MEMTLADLETKMRLVLRELREIPTEPNLLNDQKKTCNFIEAITIAERALRRAQDLVRNA